MGNRFHCRAYFSKALVPSLFIQQDLEQALPARVLLPVGGVGVGLKKATELCGPSLEHTKILSASASALGEAAGWRWGEFNRAPWRDNVAWGGSKAESRSAQCSEVTDAHIFSHSVVFCRHGRIVSAQ